MTPGQPAVLVYSLVGPGPLFATLGCGSVKIDVSIPLEILATPTANGAGVASFTTSPLPPGVTGVPIWFDALDVGTCASPDGFAATIQ